MKMKNYVFLLVLALSSSVWAAFDPAQRDIDFNADWRFCLGELPGFIEPGYPDAGWRILSLPHDWSIEGAFDPDNPSGRSGGYLPMGIGCYRKSFTLPAGFKGKRIKIRFDGVYMNSTVYLNGVYLGNRPYGFSTFEYDLTPHLKYDGQTNVMAVKVDNSLQPNCRWYSGSGINRRVHLIVTAQQHFQSFGTFFRTESLTAHSASLKVDWQVISGRYVESKRIAMDRYPDKVQRTTKPVKVVARLEDAQGQRVAEASRMQDLLDYSSWESGMTLQVTDPKLWSHRNPYLYTLVMELWVDGERVDRETHAVGIRTIEFNSQQGMLVNGEKVIAKGLCLHKDAGSLGTAVPKDVWRYRLTKLKTMGCNALRAHGPLDPVFIETCDEMGFYLMAEAFDEWEKTWEYGWSEDPQGKRPYAYHIFFRQWAETDLKTMVRRERNHPCVIMYSLGNEVPEQRYPSGTQTLMKLRDWAREEDPTRPVVAACDWGLWADRNGFLDAMDIAGYNYPDRYFPKLYQEEHAKYPHRILLGTENSKTLKDWLAVRDNPYVVGLFLWTGIDYLGGAGAWPHRGSESGLIDLAGFEKSQYYYWQAFWSEHPMVYIDAQLPKKNPDAQKTNTLASHWNFQPKDVNTVSVFGNAEEVELFLNGKSLGRQKVDPDTYQAVYQVDYEPGELRAQALNQSKQVAEHILKTAGPAAQLTLIPERKKGTSKEGELLFIAMEVQDSQGIRCPYADQNITVRVTGDAELIGLDSGNQYSHELYKQDHRKAFEGRLLITARPTGPGRVFVECSADGLQSAKITTRNDRNQSTSNNSSSNKHQQKESP